MAHGGDVYRNKVHMDFSVNLNPLGTPVTVMDTLKASIEKADQYPDPAQEQVRSALANALLVKSENVCAGSGASELLLAAIRAVDPQKAFLFEPCFSGYHHALQAAGCEVKQHITDVNHGFTITDADASVIEKDVDLIFVCDPLCPAGLNVEDEILRKILDRAGQQHATVILDESFYLLSEGAKQSDRINTEDRMDGSDQTDQTDRPHNIKYDRASDLIREYDNLIIIRSMTKTLAIPGIRCGYAIGSAKFIEKLRMQLPEWNLSMTAEEAIKAGIHVIAETDFIQQSVMLIRKERDYLSQNFRQFGIRIFDSQAPFLLFTGPECLYEELLKQGILIRDCSDYMGLGSGYYRIGVKEHSENEMLIKMVRGITDAL